MMIYHWRKPLDPVKLSSIIYKLKTLIFMPCMIKFQFYYDIFIQLIYLSVTRAKEKQEFP